MSDHPTLPDFSPVDLALAEQTLFERYGERVAVEPVEVELKLDPERSTLTAVPALYWSAREAEFVVCRLPTGGYRAQFFYSPSEQFGTGRDAYDSLGDCLIAVLQVQADEEQSRQGVKTGMTGADFGTPGKGEASDDDYLGPIVV